MSAEIAEQPDLLARLIGRRSDIIEKVQALVSPGVAGVSLVARGSSDNAAVAGRYAIELSTGKPVALGALSMHSRYGSQADLDGWLIIGISQSGATPEVADYVEMARNIGARTLAVTNGADSPLARAAELSVFVDAGTEHAVPATKTFTTTVAALLFIAEALSDAPWQEQWDDVPNAVAGCIDDPPGDYVVGSLAGSERTLVVARGFLTAAAMETALKLQETTGRPVAAYSTADLYHGPIVSFGVDTAAIVIGVDGPTSQDANEVAETLRGRGVQVITVGSALVDSDMATPPLHDALSVITTSVRGQQLALALARRLGLDPDYPEGLRKVTPTR